jgi:hypothetical protein
MPEEYKKFKIKIIGTKITLQQLVNSAIMLYNGNGGFEDIIHTTISGSVGL